MEKKVIDLRECKEDVKIILPRHTKFECTHNGEELDEILVNFHKDPLDLVPKRFEECKKACTFDTEGIWYAVSDFLPEEDVEALIALAKLRMLWHEWMGVLVTTCEKHNGGYSVCYNRHYGKMVSVGHNYMFTGILDFSEESHAENFIECFPELLEKAKILL